MGARLNASKKNMRRCDKIRGREVEDRRKEEEMTTPITLPRQNEATVAELRRRYEDTTDAETRTRDQMLVLSLRGQTSSQIAHLVLRSQDTVVRVLKRFVTGGLDAVPRRTAPGRERTVTAAWERALLRVIELDPARQSGRTARTGRPNDSASTCTSRQAFRSQKRPCACTYRRMATSVSGPLGRMPAQGRREQG